MSKVLIVGPRFYQFNESMARAFASLGWETRIEAYDNPVHPYRGWLKVRYKFARDKAALRRASRCRFSAALAPVFDAWRPDLVFMMNGDMVAPALTDRFRAAGARVALWLFDSVRRIPLGEDNLRHADAVFCYERSDIDWIRQRHGVEAHFLPQAVDTEMYHPIAGAEKKYDIVFAGDLYHSERRRRIVHRLVERYPDRRICVWGIYKPWYKNPIRCLLRERRDVYRNRNTDFRQLNEDYNGARLVLNIHHEQQRDGANPKVFEIAASGAFQVCDANPYIERLFPHGELGLYHDDEELFRLIDAALAGDVSARADAARREVCARHTFAHRVEQVLAVLNPDESLGHPSGL